MNFKLLFIFSLALGTVFLDAIRLVEHLFHDILLKYEVVIRFFLCFSLKTIKN